MSLFSLLLDCRYTENGFVDQPLYWIGDNSFLFVREVKVSFEKIVKQNSSDQNKTKAPNTEIPSSSQRNSLFMLVSSRTLSLLWEVQVTVVLNLNLPETYIV